MFERWTRRGKARNIEGMAEGPLAARVETLVGAGKVSQAADLLRSAYEGSVRAFVAKRLRGVDAEIREDICQDVWLAAIEGRPLSGRRGP